MAPEPVNQQRTYEAIRHALFAGKYPVGVRIDLKTLAEGRGISLTPVREAIMRLVGERLFEQHPSGGFRVAVPDSDRLAQLYDWNLHHLLAVLGLVSSEALDSAFARLRGRTIGRSAAELAVHTAMIFRMIGSTVANPLFIEQIDMASDRLHYARIAESRSGIDVARELNALVEIVGVDVKARVRRRILAFHRRRIARASRIAATILSMGNGQE